ncbi:hypothetical protein KL933_004785 [Ogataea haglerorum]|uniref:Aminotransferase class I/classII large domain-containing protein n=1 Tax=Ogataea haglerorum TaxID=1937702 RepID=A0AAN6HZE2_9ASCO|nr:hypothetical protein KL951_003136 [Ogataea haglerorum]KAG7724591.1 hypothetical protein KL933_004785 [Ogataea haglerorum]KAG7731739.1 hypothetical protein KL948_002672 [Ogataea haglerorum]KAG7739096.1 hypothetical protein KL923_002896 [Ogataea haglerorum]KAG7758608.1 hypothetical protein KL947_002277 [Ogataea haglerorum]
MVPSPKMPPKYNFFRGHPSPYLLPTREVLDATTSVYNRVIENEHCYDDVSNRHPLQYGLGLGNEEVRQAIADWNNRCFEMDVRSEANCINLTNGASYGVMNILAQTTSPHNGITRRAFLVTPTYFLINSTFIDAGFGGKLTGIEELSNGQLDLDEFASKLKYYDSLVEIKPPRPEDLEAIQHPSKMQKKVYRYVLYLTPTFSNPRGGTLTLSTRHKLIDLARKHDVLIICDDVYDVLNYTSEKLVPRLVYCDKQTLPDTEGYGNTVSNATFSKLAGPGLRVGWQETVSPKLVMQIHYGGANISGGAPSHTNSVIIGEMVKTGAMDDIVSKLCKVYSERALALKEAVEKYMPKGTRLDGGNGGYFVWITLPDGYNCRVICEMAAKQGLVLANGDHFEVVGDSRGWGAQTARLSISFLSKTAIVEGIKLWGDICKTYKQL